MYFSPNLIKVKLCLSIIEKWVLNICLNMDFFSEFDRSNILIHAENIHIHLFHDRCSGLSL